MEFVELIKGMGRTRWTVGSKILKKLLMPYVYIIKIKFYSSADLDLDSTLEFAQYLRFKYS